MTGDELVTLTRELIRDEVAPFLWSTETIIRYLQEAEREMCKRTHVLLSTSLSVTFATGVNTATLPANVLQVLSAKVNGETQSLHRARAQHFPMYQNSTTTGTPRCYTTGMGSRRMVVHPVPDADVDVDYVAAIFPLIQFEESDSPSVPEERHHILGSYAAYRCLRTKDPDGEELQEHMVYKQEWEIYLRDMNRELSVYRIGEKAAINQWTRGFNYGQ